MFSTLSAVDVWGAGRWTRDLAAQVLQAHVDPHPAGTVYRLSDNETKLRWMCKQYGPAMMELVAELGSWECLGLTLRDTLAAELKKRPLKATRTAPQGPEAVSPSPPPPRCPENGATARYGRLVSIREWSALCLSLWSLLRGGCLTRLRLALGLLFGLLLELGA